MNTKPLLSVHDLRAGFAAGKRVLAANLLADAVRDAFDPRMAGAS